MAANGFMIREDQFVIKVQVGSGSTAINFPGVTSWTSLEGGAIEADDTFTRPGGMLPGVNLGGPAKRSDATVKRQYTSGMHPYVAALDQATGFLPVAISWWPIDANNNVTGGSASGTDPLTGTPYSFGGYQLTGVLKGVQVPNMDANAQAVGFIALVIGCDVELKTGITPF